MSQFKPGVVDPGGDRGSALFFALRGGELLLSATEPVAIPLGDQIDLDETLPCFLGWLDGQPCYAVEHERDAPPGLQLVGLREAFGLLPEPVWIVAGRAAQILMWDRTHRFCGQCGGPTVDAVGERAKRCPVCELSFFPRLSPAVIVLVERGHEALLARGPRFPPGRFALVAGFVEPGESLEDAVRREIEEEVGILVDRVTYFGSQPWPFPNSIMIGFFAQYAGGELRPDATEIEDARWFTADAMPSVPPRLSIARKLIDAYAAKHGVVLTDP